MKFNYHLLALLESDQPAESGLMPSSASLNAEKLRGVCKDKSVVETVLSGASTEIPEAVSADTVVLIAGKPSADQLTAVCHSLQEKGAGVIIVADALENFDDLHPTLVALNEQLFEISMTGAVTMLLKSKRPFIYPFPKPDSTTTMVVLIENASRVLMIERDRDPYKDFESLPGGFLNVQLEDLPGCCARETEEETSVVSEPDDWQLVDVRSSPTRDNRGHVIDHGYMWVVPADRTDEVVGSVCAKDDAKPGTARFVPVEEALAGDMAFDHKDLLEAAVKLASAQISSCSGS